MIGDAGMLWYCTAACAIVYQPSRFKRGLLARANLGYLKKILL